MSKTSYTGVSKDEKTGKYVYYFKAGIDKATGKPYQERRRGFNTAKEAHEARIKSMKKIHDMGGISYSQMTFEQFINDIYLPDYIARTEQRLKDNGLYQFKQLIEFFGKKKPKDITIFDVTRYKNQLLAKYSKNGARKKMGVLSHVLKTAKNYGLMRDNLAEKVGRIPMEKVEIDFWTTEEFEKFVSSLDRSDYFEQFIFTMIWLYFFTGMRVSEGLALWWSDIDLEKRKISIGHNLDYATKNNWIRKNKLKTEKSKRVISIDEDTVQVLKDWKERQKELSTKFEFVLSYDLTPNDSHFVRDMLKKYCERAGVRRIQAKALRHSHASLLINEYNVTPLLIQKRLGHTDVKTTLGIYSHLYPNADEEITSQLKNLINIEKLPKGLPNNEKER
ncbi:MULTISPECIES: tyrosine-type recombinase/integrase [Lactococcus]|uniref:Site-specific integrase n=1 Tax=Lactococcus garvieae TaxID=1363 RepID=A0AAX3NA49_9LACT|nr:MULTISPECIES: site-specific integrase [Lactococcus]MBD5824598.1 site-specific integrase [Lactococcus petauri]WEA13294.1 site-specific integrase [Lactococcus garvieae]